MSKTKILIVEDERIVAEDISYCLEKIGYTVTATVSSGDAAIKVIQRNPPDLVMMDIVIVGDMNGIETAKVVRSRFDIPVVYLTAYADEKTLEKAKISEPFGYILKPFEQREIQSTIETALYKHRMEKKLRESKAWFSTILQSIGDGVIVTDKTGNITFMNPVAENLTGWKSEEVIGKFWKKVFHIIQEGTGKPLKNPFQIVLDEGKVVGLRNHTILKTRDGRSIPIDDSMAPIKDKRGEIVGVVLVFHDIIERKMSEEALKQSEERYRSLFEESRDAIYISTRKGKFVITNQSTIDLFGYSPTEMIKLNLGDLFVNAEDWQGFQNIIEKKGSVRDYEVKLKNKNGGLLYCLLTSTVRKTDHNKILGYQGIIRDITARKQAEEEKEKIQAQLFQAQKMEAVGILAGGIAHDFNNLLTVIQGNTDLAMLKLEEKNPVYRDLQEVQLATERAADLTSQLLMFSRKQNMKFDPLNINKVVEGMLKILHRLIGEDMSISMDLDELPWMAKADRGTMEQVIMNLAVNARDAMPKGGKVLIRTQNCELDENQVEIIPEGRRGKFIRLTISDEGVGMDENTIQHIFEPFFSTKGTGKGTGLGLSVVYGIVKQHNGFLHVESVPKKGTTFDIYLPVISGKHITEKEEMISLDTIKGNQKRILVIEDEKGVRDFTETALVENDYQVFTASSGSEALEIFKREKGQFDLILSDVVLADETGVELVGKFLKKKPDLKVLLCSGYTGKKSQWSLIQEKGYYFMQKPYTLFVLLKTIYKILS